MYNSMIFITLTSTLVLKIENKNENQKENKNEKENKKKLSLSLSVLTLPPSQGFSSRETDFHFHQFLSNLLRYSFSNFTSSHLYNIFSIYFSGNSSLLKFFSSILSNFSCFLISVLILPSNFSTASLTFPRSSSLSYVSCPAINLFQHIKYFSTPLLFKILSTSHSLTLSTSTGFASFFFYPSTCSLYHTIWLTFTTG